MSSGGPPLIAPKVHECVRRFSALCGLLPEADRIARPALVDQLGRLKIWAGNIGAFQELPLQSSLDYRLREAPKIVDQVIELLNDLNETLQEVSSIISGERPNRVNAITDGGTDDLNSGNDDDDDNGDEASVLSDQSQPSSELEELLESSSDTITSLFKISVLVKSATTRDRYAKAAKAQGEPFDSRFDISHVGHKFPLVHQTDWLEKRLGKAITQRRQYLRYCREHRDRLDTQHKAADVTENAVDRQPMPVRKPVEESHEATKSQIQSLKPPSTFAITTASTLVVTNLESLEEYPDEVQSQTSYATSINEDESSDMLRVPPLPDEGVRGLPFECPYCWAPQLIKTRRAWIKHLFQDLKPYVCTFEECDLKIFADRSSWFSHELQVHRIEWCCPFCTHAPLQSLESFEDHLQNRHAQKFIKEQLSALGATCQQSVERISPQACPFCDEWFVKLKDANPDLAGETLVETPAQFQHHVGSHMEQLALFALPKDHGDAVESTGVAGGADNRADSELGSKASYECHENPPLHIAAYEGLEAEVFQLLKDGAKVNAPGKTWGNVLQAAVVGGHVSIVQLLLEYGAEVTLYGGPYGQYSLHTAIQSGDGEIVRLLRDAREKTELKSNKEVRRIYSDHEEEKQEALEITENRDISLDLETRYQIALRYPRASYTCPVCGEKCGDANQLWGQHAVSRHQLSLGIMRPDDDTEVQKHLIVSAERLSHNQSQSAIRATGGSDTVLLIDSARTISIRAEIWFQLLLPDDLALFSDIANVRSRLPRFIDILAKSKLEAKAGRFFWRLPLERDLKLLLQNLGRSLEVLMLTLETVTTAVSNGQMRIKPPGNSNGFEWKCIYSLASEVYVGMDLLDSTLRKFPEPAPPPLPPPRHLDDLSAGRDPGWQWGVEPAVTTQGRRTVLRNTKDTEGAEDPEEPQDHEDPQDSGDFELFEDSEGPENPENPSDFGDLVYREAEAFKGRVLVDHIKFVIDKAIVIDSRVQMVHRSEASTLPDAITSIQQNLPQIINTLLKTQEQADLGTYNIYVEAPFANLLDKLPPILGNIERFFGSDEQRQARQSPDDPQAEEVQRVSETIETILVGIRKHESEIPMVSGMLEPEAYPGWGSSKKEGKKKRARKWLYLDVDNRLRGPWSDTQIYAWYEAGYLPGWLCIREANDTDFQPLSRVIGLIDKTQSVDSTPLLQTPPGLTTIKNQQQFPPWDDILPKIIRFMEASNLPFNPNPIIGLNHVDVADLYLIVVTNGGSKRITVGRGWVNVAISVGLHTEKFPNAPQELENYWNQNLWVYEEFRQVETQKQRQALSQMTGNVLPSHVNSELMVSAGDDGDTYDSGLKFEPKQSSNNQSARINIENVQNEEISAPSPSFDLQSFGPGAPEGYEYKYSDCTGKRKALLIGITRERHMIATAHLRKYYGFELDNITILSDQAKDDTYLPTKENILKGMAWLVEGARTDDCLFFQYEGPTHRITGPNKGEGSPFFHAFRPVDFEKAGPITSDDMHQIMVQPLRQGVRLTALFDDPCYTSPLKTPYIYSAEAVLEAADFSTKATRTVLAQFSSNARTILRSMTSSSPSRQPHLPDYGLENLIKTTKTSPADVIVIYSCRDPSDPKDPWWSTALAFFNAHRYNRGGSYAHILSTMEANVPSYLNISHRLSCSHPLDMQARFIM